MMLKDNVDIGDTVEVKSGWFRRGVFQGIILKKGIDKALVFGEGSSLGSYRYETMTLVEKTGGNEILKAAREFIKKVEPFL